MKTTYTISVVIPAYNGELYLRRSIDSVLAQTYEPMEIIVVDDGSSDKTAEIAKSYKNKITYIYQKNSGAAAARNTGIEMCRGAWVAFLDADDEWRSHHLENAVRILRNHPELKWYGASINQYIQESGKLSAAYRRKKPGILVENAYFEDYMVAYPPYAHFATPTMVIHRSVFHIIGGFDVTKRTGHDLNMWFRIGLQFPKVGYSHEVAANIYKRKTSLSYTKNHDFRKSLATLAEREKMAQNLGQLTRRRAEPRLMHAIEKLLKASLSRGNIIAIREILAVYEKRIAPSLRWLAHIYLTFPWAIQPIFTLRNTLSHKQRQFKRHGLR